MMQKIQRFGGAMFAPVLLFAFSGIMVGFSILFKNQEIMGSLAAEGSLWTQIWTLVESGAWTVFNQLPLLFVIGLPIGLAKKEPARCCMEALVVYLTFNYFLNAIFTMWGPQFGVDLTKEVGGGSGLTMIAGIKTLDTGMLGSIIIAGIVVYLHDHLFDFKLPEFLGTFKGSSFICMVGFFVMIPVAFIFALVWPHIQDGISLLQGFLKSSGVIGVWVYTFLERILIPTGLHHFIYAPFIFDSAVVPGGINVYWAHHLKDFMNTKESLKQMFPAGGFALHGMSKVFGSVGISLAIYTTAKASKRKVVAGLLIPVTLTAVVAGITEPLEFTFLFVAPILFVVHAILAATMSAIAFACGVSGNFGGGLIDWLALNWIPLWKYHWQIYLIQIGIGLVFTLIYFIVFRFLIIKLDCKTPGREDDDDSEETKLYTKADYKNKKGEKLNSEDAKKAAAFLEGLGGSSNISDVTNCATRLRVSVVDPSKVKDQSFFKASGAHGLVVKGKAIQIIVGLSVPQVRAEFEKLM